MNSFILQNYLQSLLTPIPRSAICLTDGRSLHVQSENAVDFAALGHAAKVCHQYLQLKKGDLAVLNDPSLAGSSLNELTWVGAVQAPGNNEVWLLTWRQIFPWRLVANEKTITERHLRLPPVPVWSNGELNNDLVKSLADQPEAPGEFAKLIALAKETLGKAQKSADALFAKPVDWKFETRDLFAAQQAQMEMAISRLPLGTQPICEVRIMGTLVRLQIEVKEKRVLFNFTGTEAGNQVAISELATFGACFHCLQIVLERTLPTGAGSFGLIEVRAPVACAVGAKANVSQSFGQLFLLPALRGMVVRSFAKSRMAHLTHADSSFGLNFLGLQFSDGRYLSTVWPGGSGAGEKGAPTHFDVRCLSAAAGGAGIEDMETRWPIQVLNCGVRVGSGGRGAKVGQDGLIFAFKALVPCTLNWILSDHESRPAGENGGKAAQAKEAIVTSATGKKTALTAFGSIDLNEGCTVHLLTAGGGGYGDPDADSEEEG